MSFTRNSDGQCGIPINRPKGSSITSLYPSFPGPSSTDLSSSFDSSSSLPLPDLSPVLSPVKRVLSNSTPSNVKTFIKKNIFNEQTRPTTEGPMTRRERTPSLEGDLNDYGLSYDSNKLGYMNEIILDPLKIPEILISGLQLLKIGKKRSMRIFKLDLEQALVTWNNGKFMNIDNIQQIRIGEDAKNYREEYGISQENDDTWITIIYTKSKKLKSLHLIARNRNEFGLFVSTLTKLVYRRRELMRYLSIPDEDFANIHWKNYISKGNKNKESLFFDDILKLTKRLHINCDDKILFQLFKETDTDKKDSLNFTQFQMFVKKLKTRPEIIRIFDTITGGSNVLNREGFIDFVKNTQKQDEPEEITTKWFEKCSNDGKIFTIDDFTNYLTSSHVTPLKMETGDLTRPLNEYFISSSHNTYLIGRQFGTSSSSIEGYVRALQKGCRSIELDVWDGDHGPVIRHGKLTSSLQIKDVLQVIRKYAFIFTPYPLVLSFEIHCKIEYQLTLKEYIFEILSDTLLTQPILQNSFTLPSPMDLKHKILIKVKRTEFDDFSLSRTPSSSFTSSSTAYEELDTDEAKVLANLKKKKRNQPKIIPELSALGVYTSGLKFRNFSLPESKTINHVFSFSESSFNAMIKEPEKDYLISKHNRKYLMRLYPSRYRYNSSNFNPIKFWSYGAQMVATNWQTYDLGQEVNEAMFDHGKSSGYVLKPSELRDISPNTKFKLMIFQPPSIIKFKIEIISGQLLPRPNELKLNDQLSPYVIFEFIDSKLPEGVFITDMDTGLKYHSQTNLNATKPIYANGFNPIWNYRFEGELESLKGLDFIRFQVKTGEITFAVNCIKLDHLNQGYRHIPLYDLQGEEYIFSTLFINAYYEKI